MPRRLRSQIGKQTTTTAVVDMQAFREAAQRAAEGAPFEMPKGSVRALVTMRHVPIEQRALVTVGQGIPWRAFPEVVRGAIVRLKPPADVSDAEIEQQRQELLAGGAAAVQVEPRAAGGAVVAPAREQHTAQSHRAVIMEMTKEARAADPKALAELVDELLTKQGI
jgi:hypothetical protein